MPGQQTGPGRHWLVSGMGRVADRLHAVRLMLSI